MKHFIIFSLVLAGAAVHVRAQSSGIKENTILWSSSKSTDLKTNVDRDSESSFKTFSTDKVEFTQGSHTRTLQITDTNGTWENVNESGKIVFSVEHRGVRGTLTLEKNSTETYALLDFTSMSSAGMKQKFIISSTQIQ
ncbi:MAG TPA: hypothetical protein VL728_12760 [Cyclobacteriaceae bacterium]|nr:hypothetical protein [Cyclobacteriaceae bacterium]